MTTSVNIEFKSTSAKASVTINIYLHNFGQNVYVIQQGVLQNRTRLSIRTRKLGDKHSCIVGSRMVELLIHAPTCLRYLVLKEQKIDLSLSFSTKSSIKIYSLSFFSLKFV